MELSMIEEEYDIVGRIEALDRELAWLQKSIYDLSRELEPVLIGGMTADSIMESTLKAAQAEEGKYTGASFLSKSLYLIDYMIHRDNAVLYELCQAVSLSPSETESASPVIGILEYKAPDVWYVESLVDWIEQNLERMGHFICELEKKLDAALEDAKVDGSDVHAHIALRSKLARRIDSARGRICGYRMRVQELIDRLDLSEYND